MEGRSLILTSLHLRHISFSNPSAALLTSQLILQPFHCFTYVIRTSPTSQINPQPFRCFTYITAHSPTLPPLHLRRSSFSNHSVALPTSQLILQPFRRYTYVTAHSPSLPSLHLRHSSFPNLSVTSPTLKLVLQTSRGLYLRHSSFS